MSRGTIRGARGGLTERFNTTGPDSYSSGGFSVRSDLGRVDETNVHAQDTGGTGKDFDATASVSSSQNNQVVVKAHSQSSGTEAEDGTDLSDTEFSFTNARL